MRKFIGTLASVFFKAKLHSAWCERWPDGWLVELVDLDLDYTKDMDYSVEDTHFPDTKAPFVWTHTVMLSLTLVNFTLNLSVGWESEP